MMHTADLHPPLLTVTALLLGGWLLYPTGERIRTPKPSLLRGLLHRVHLRHRLILREWGRGSAYGLSGHERGWCLEIRVSHSRCLELRLWLSKLWLLLLLLGEGLRLRMLLPILLTRD